MVGVVWGGWGLVGCGGVCLWLCCWGFWWWVLGGWCWGCCFGCWRWLLALGLVLVDLWGWLVVLCVVWFCGWGVLCWVLWLFCGLGLGCVWFGWVGWLVWGCVGWGGWFGGVGLGVGVGCGGWVFGGGLGGEGIGRLALAGPQNRGSQ
ncbi:hypothetical protein, partial [Pseudomonas syringae group genomosp. 7]|uniref:hypothetical protein n=1 Tax=Pseudomonas syringae group genomosp. 7 TaxID=251699 RepID=UPI00376FB93E